MSAFEHQLGIRQRSRFATRVTLSVLVGLIMLGGTGAIGSIHARYAGGGGGGCGSTQIYNNDVGGQQEDVWGDISWYSISVQVSYNECSALSGTVWFDLSSAGWWNFAQYYDGVLCVSIWAGSYEVWSEPGVTTGAGWAQCYSPSSNGGGSIGLVSHPALTPVGQTYLYLYPLSMITTGYTIKLYQSSWYSCLCDVDVGPWIYWNVGSLTLTVPTYAHLAG